MSVITLETQTLSFLSPDAIREAINNVISSIQQHSKIKEKNLILDADLSRSLSIANHVFNELGLNHEYTASDVLFMTDAALKKLHTSQQVNQFRDEVIKQFEVLRVHFTSIPNHGYSIAITKQTHENNTYGLAKWLADQQFSLSKTVNEAFNVFNADDLTDWIKTPLKIDQEYNEIYLAVLLDILSQYSYIEFKKILKI